MEKLNDIYKKQNAKKILLIFLGLVIVFLLIGIYVSTWEKLQKEERYAAAPSPTELSPNEDNPTLDQKANTRGELPYVKSTNQNSNSDEIPHSEKPFEEQIKELYPVPPGAENVPIGAPVPAGKEDFSKNPPPAPEIPSPTPVAPTTINSNYNYNSNSNSLP